VPRLQQLHLTHFAIVSGLGAGLDATLTALRNERGCLQPRAYAGGIETWVGEVDGLEAAPLDEGFAAFACRNNALAALALRQDGFLDAIAALRDKYGADRIGVFLGTSTSGINQTELAYRRRNPETGQLPSDFGYAETHNLFSLGTFLGRLLRLSGPSMVASAACATTAKVFGTAARMIAAGFCDAAIVGGADSLCATTLYGFHSLGLVSSVPCRPFDKARSGISIGEAAGFAIVEKARPGDLPSGAIVLSGFGESSDAYHMSTPHPDGVGARLAMERALASAGFEPNFIDYINVHGTGTSVGDAAEDRAVAELFGPETPCSSTKGYTGHTLGAAGIVEAVISALALRNGFIPGSVNTREIDPAFRSHYVAANRPARLNRVLSNSFGFGGNNCSLILECSP
jgi:3-oxoacyl-[acyl-carrier-protein] synthase I